MSKVFLPIQGLPDVKWCDLQKVLPKPERMVYIIDDLERAGMEAEEVLGYINEMTEHEAAKVIILANEEEIYRINDFTKSLQKKKQNAAPPKRPLGMREGKGMNGSRRRRSGWI